MAPKCLVDVHDNAVTSGYLVSACVLFFLFVCFEQACTVMKRYLTPLSFVKSLESGWIHVWNSNELTQKVNCHVI